MPELPEVETVRRGLKPFILNKKIVQVIVEPGKCFQGDASRVEGATVVEIGRRGKALLVGLDNGYTLLIHLRMTGQLIWRGSSLEQADELSLSSGSVTLSASKELEPRQPKNNLQTVKASSASASVSSSGPRIVSSSMHLQKDDSPSSSSIPIPLTTPQVDAAHGNFAAGHPSKNFTDKLPNKQTRVTFVFDEGKLFFNDQRKFGFVKVLLTTEVKKEKFIAELAKEPWEMRTEELLAQCQRHGKSPIKAVLLNQKIIAGLGNIYADESLFYAGVNPTRRAGDLSEKEVALLLEGACKTMQAAIDSGGSTMATYIRPDGTTGDYLEKFAQVFRREGKPCPRCGAMIEKMRCAGRGTHYCPKCQVLPKDSLSQDVAQADELSLSSGKDSLSRDVAQADELSLSSGSVTLSASKELDPRQPKNNLQIAKASSASVPVSDFRSSVSPSESSQSALSKPNFESKADLPYNPGEKMPVEGTERG